MIKFPVHNIKGEKRGEINLSDEVFGVPMNEALLHQAYVAIYSNQRAVISHTKDRGERAGSGKKPWKQKGTGNARVGQVRNPLWRKGGVAFGPTKDKNYTKNINKKMNQKAIKVALSDKTRNNELFILEDISLPEKKTKFFADVLNNLKIGKKVLVGFSDKESAWKLASRNIPRVSNISTKNFNVFDILNNRYLLLSKDSVKFLEEKYK